MRFIFVLISVLSISLSVLADGSKILFEQEMKASFKGYTISFQILNDGKVISVKSFRGTKIKTTIEELAVLSPAKLSQFQQAASQLPKETDFVMTLKKGQVVADGGETNCYMFDAQGNRVLLISNTSGGGIVGRMNYLHLCTIIESISSLESPLF